MKFTLSLILFFTPVSNLLAQANYSRETAEQIKAVENSLAGPVKIDGIPDYNIADRMKYYNLKGLSIAVVHNYKVVWAKGYGWANEAEKIPVTPETLFEPGSISKSLNAVGVLKLVQDKKLDLYTDINDYLRSWKFPYDAVSRSKKITLAQLLSHSAGLSVHGFPGYDLRAQIPTVPQVLDGKPPANTEAVRSEFEPGLKYRYSGGGITISQLIVTDVTQRAYDAFMYETVLKPIGMIHSSYTQPPPKEKQSLCASGYFPDGTPVLNRFHVYPEQAAAGLWMTPGDLCQYIIETQLAYEGRSSKVLNREMTRLMLTPYNDASSALGVFIEKHNNSLYFQHSAGNQGFCGIYYGSLEGGDGVAIFVNSENPGILQEVVNSVATVYKWKDFYTPVYKKEVGVPEHVLEQYPGIYLYDDNWASIFKKDSAYYFFTRDVTARMHFSSDSSFFNLEFSADKVFVKDKNGNVTGYKRKANGQEFPAAAKVMRPDTLHLDSRMLNEIAWHLLETQRPAGAMPYLNRALEQDPGDLLPLGNLAHCYLFSNNYQKAIDIYRAHLNEIVGQGFTWQDMIKQDFLFFKNHGYDNALLKKALAGLDIEQPDGL